MMPYNRKKDIGAHRQTSRQFDKSPIEGRDMHEMTLGSFGKFFRGKGVSKKQIIRSGGLPCIRYAEIYTDYNETVKNFISMMSAKDAKNALPVQKNDIIFPASDVASIGLIGKALAYLGAETAYAGGDTLVFRNHGQNPAYLAYALNEWCAVKQKLRLAVGQPILHLHASELMQVSITLPSLAEQDQIAKILLNADAAITTAARLAKEYRKNFESYRNQLMMQIDRSVKNITAISEFAEIPIFESIISADDELLLKVSLHCKGIKVNEGRKVKINPKGRPYSKRKKGDFLIGRQNIHNGGFGFVPAELNGCIASNAITSLRLNPSLINDRFFIHYFTRPSFYRRLEVLMGGTGQKEIGENELMRIKIPVPDMEQQNQIADRIDTYLHMAKMQEYLVFALKKQKRGLMQQLLTGKLRIPTKKRAGK